MAVKQAWINYFSSYLHVQDQKGWAEIQRHIQQLEGAHLRHLMVYGNGNAERLLQQRKLSSALRLSWGLEDRAASLRIPHSTFLQRRGWYEDRRPASNMDPYLVPSLVSPAPDQLHCRERLH